jgi:hypothetical protein
MRSALLLALALGWAANATAQQAQASPPDPARMSRRALEAEVMAARPYIQNGGVNAARTPGCSAPEARQLDFWVGEWDVSPPGSAMVVAESTIRAVDQGCSILEEWRPFAGAGGHSISSYDRNDSSWHQEWVDGTGQRTVFKGSLVDDAMRLDNLSPPPQGAPANLRRRMNYQQIDANTVRQWGERFDETTQQWVVAWDFTYRRRAGTRR